MKQLIYLSFIVLIFSCQSPVKQGIEITGEFLQWHKVTFVIQGPETSEWAEENPFLDYKVEAVFSQGNKTYNVPGYYAADGNAGETSAKSGNTWKIHFSPNATGTWNYEVSFRKGKNIAVLDGEALGEEIVMDGGEGSMEIAASDKSGPDFRGKGRIINGGNGYFKFQRSDDIWIKNGADSPENFLAYADFDQTSRFSLKKEVREGEADPKESLHKYGPHLGDWQEGNPDWQDGKGKGMIGALNYLQSAGVNSVYMLTMNIIGDGKDVWPYTDYNERYRFDCSKLDQWEMVLEYMDQLGIMAHFVLQETENECLLDMGHTEVQRRLYLRELIARFGHHLAISWNLGEENGPAPWTPIGQTDAQKKDMANYIKQINPYPSNVVLHTHSGQDKQDEYLTPMLGFESLDGPSIQEGNPELVHGVVRRWVLKSTEAGKPWIVNFDELGPHWKGVMPDSYDADHDTIRHLALWGALLAGGTGVEWYFGYRYPHTDLTCEDFRSRETWWKQSSIATQFVNRFPLEEMNCQDELVNIKDAYCLSKTGEVYLVYLPARTQQASLKIDSEEALQVKWFNPREGGELQDGSITSLQGSGNQFLGEPPVEPEKDWVVVIGQI
jgi:hypothetical protein